MAGGLGSSASAGASDSTGTAGKHGFGGEARVAGLGFRAGASLRGEVASLGVGLGSRGRVQVVVSKAGGLGVTDDGPESSVTSICVVGRGAVEGGGEDMKVDMVSSRGGGKGIAPS